jgi:hypothetical protein
LCAWINRHPQRALGWTGFGRCLDGSWARRRRGLRWGPRRGFRRSGRLRAWLGKRLGRRLLGGQNGRKHQNYRRHARIIRRREPVASGRVL